MSRARAELKIILRDGKGRFAPLSRARNFEVFYGKRKLLARTEFPARWRVAAKKEFVEELLLQFYLEQELRRYERQEKKKIEILKKEKRKKPKKRVRVVKVLNAEKDSENYLLFSNECDKVAYLVKQDEVKLVTI